MTADAQFWDDIAETYSRRPLANPDATARKLESVRSLMSPTDVVLDIGCGTGTTALELAGDAKLVHGVDISKEMIEIARRKTKTQSVTNVEFRAATITDGLRASRRSPSTGSPHSTSSTS